MCYGVEFLDLGKMSVLTGGVIPDAVFPYYTCDLMNRLIARDLS